MRGVESETRSSVLLLAEVEIVEVEGTAAVGTLATEGVSKDSPEEFLGIYGRVEALVAAALTRSRRPRPAKVVRHAELVVLSAFRIIAQNLNKKILAFTDITDRVHKTPLHGTITTRINLLLYSSISHGSVNFRGL